MFCYYLLLARHRSVSYVTLLHDHKQTETLGDDTLPTFLKGAAVFKALTV